MISDVLWGWSCGKDSNSAIESGTLGECFADTVLIALPAALTIFCLLALFVRDLTTRSSTGQTYRSCRKNSSVEQLHLLDACISATICCFLGCFMLDWTQTSKAALVRLLQSRPHVAVASACSLLAWLLSAIYMRRVLDHSRKRMSGLSCCFTGPLLGCWLLQAACLSTAAVSRALEAQSRPINAQATLRLAAAALELTFVALAAAEEAHLRRVFENWQAEAVRMPSLASLLQPEEDYPPPGTGPLALSSRAGPDVWFGWVSPLMRRGAQQQLQFTDLFELDEGLLPSYCRGKLWHAWTEERQRKDQLTAKSGRLQHASLLIAFARAFGRPYLVLGFIKLANDVLNFAGPVLLNLLVSYLSDEEEPNVDNPGGINEHGVHKFWHRRKGYVFALLLGLTALLKAVLSCQYSFWQGRIACQLRTAVTCAVFNKSLMLSSANMAAFSSGGVQTLMSVDADRVVNLCASLHELWSLPLQIAAALVLLYTQVRFAFAAGVAVVLLLIPLNRWLATKIEAASTSMMACKDVRIKRMGELLRGIRQIKAAAWEPSFIARVNEARNGELRALAVRKYLDALCVYFWAATPILMSLLTFGLFILLGHDLTAPIVFTSLALFNILIAPLNSFPWVINGVVEAVVSVRRLQNFLASPEMKAEWSYKTAPSAPLARECSVSFEFDAPPTPTFSTPLLQDNQPSNTTRFSIGSYDSIDIPKKLPRPLSAAFGSNGQLPVSFAVVFDNASFSWQPQQPGLGRVLEQDDVLHWSSARLSSGNLVLRNIDLALPQGSLTVVVGEVGSGKSTLLAAALGELMVAEGQLSVRGSVAYVPQQPWILSGTVRDNILFGKAFSQSRYQAVLHACALEKDVEQMSSADLTLVGDRGAALSGGQRARLALARALYQDADVYLLDDVLASVDPPIASWLLQNAICGPLMQHKTRILCSHSVACATSANRLVRMRSGRASTAPVQDPLPETSSLDSDDTARLSTPEQWSLAEELLVEQPSTTSPAESALPGAGLTLRVHMQGSQSASEQLQEALQMMPEPVQTHQPLETPGAGPGDEVEEESRQIGHVRWSVYGSYITAIGPLLASIILASLLLMQASRNGSDVWLSYWVDHALPQKLRQAGSRPSLKPCTPLAFACANLAWDAAGSSTACHRIPLLHMADWWRDGNGSDSSASCWIDKCGGPVSGQVGGHVRDVQGIHLPEGVTFFLSVLLLFAACNSLSTLIRAFSFAGGGLAAAEKLHSRLTAAVVKAPASFFDRVPIGRVLNRFSSDTATADDSLPFIANLLLANLASLAGVLLVLAYSQPLLLILVLPLGAVYFWLQKYYQQTSREVRRLNSISRSPVYSGFSEALEGAPSVRAFGQQQRFAELNEAAVGVMQQTTIAGVAVAQWLAMRLQLMAAVLVTAVALLAVLDHDGLLPRFSARKARGMAGLVGLSLSYALPITGLLNGLLTSSAETEQEMVAVERVLEYSKLEPQADTLPPLRAAEDVPSASEAASSSSGLQAWPSRGHVRLCGVGLQYREGGPWALHSIDLEVMPGQKVGVVGRTGAGKSSLVSVLLRLTEISDGALLIDGRDVRQAPLRQLRRRVGLVPQMAFLFEGSIRQNLDPAGEFSDRDMIRVLKEVHLWEILCGISLSQAKEEEESPRHSSHRNSRLRDPVTPPQSPRQNRSAPLAAARPPSQTATPRDTISSPRDITGRPPIGSPRNSYNSPRCLTLGAAAVTTASTSLDSGTPHSVVQRPPGPGEASGRPAEDHAKGSSSRSVPQAVPRFGMPRGGLSGTLKAVSIPSTGKSTSAGPRSSSDASQSMSHSLPEKQSLLSEEIKPDSQPSMSVRTGADRSPQLRPLATRRGPSRLQRRSIAAESPTSFSRFLGFGHWMDRMAEESPAVLLHAGFGIQLLSMRLGEGGLGLSQGQQQLLCLARALLSRPPIICLDECTASVDPLTAELMQQLIQDQLAGCTVIQVAHRMESVLVCDSVVVMEGGRIVEQGAPRELLSNPRTHFACMQRAQKEAVPS